MATLGARTRWDPFPSFRCDDVWPVLEQPLFPIQPGEDVLKDSFFRVDELSGFSIELPQDAGFADREGGFSIADIDQDPLVHFIEIERLAANVLEVPGDRTVVGPQRQRRTG